MNVTISRFPTVTYYRQVSALCDLPAESGVDHPSVLSLFPSDVVDHARALRDIIGPSGTGAYTNSQGLVGFRHHVVQYLQERDGHDAFEGDVFLTNGASSGIEMVLNAIIATDYDAVVGGNNVTRMDLLLKNVSIFIDGADSTIPNLFSFDCALGGSRNRVRIGRRARMGDY